MFQVTCFKCKLCLASTVASVLLLVTLGPNIHVATGEETTSSKGTWLAPGVEELPELPMGPFVRLGDGSILAVDTASSAIESLDEGKTWKSRPIFLDTAKYAIRPERALLRTPSGVIILAFANDKEKANWNWNKAISDSPGARLPTYVVRSPDDGKTWEPPQKLHDDWTGAIRDMIRTRDGTIVFTSMMMQHAPGRHSVVTYSSADEGKTWRRSNTIDRGGIGHHAGVTEATIEQLRDSRIWMLMRTNWKTFWEAYSTDDGVTWTSIGPTKIDASSAPGLLMRLQSGRLILVWNRYYPEGQTDFPLSGGDNQWSEVPVSNHRLELSIMFSDDDGKTWTDPAVIARNKKGWIAYPYLFEAHPGELWITTMQGGLRVRIHEKDFVGK
ncbi:MAG: sialidase family protein [Planctomycetota bacterium]